MGCAAAMVTSSLELEELANFSSSGTPLSIVVSLTIFLLAHAVLSISGSNGSNVDPELHIQKHKIP